MKPKELFKFPFTWEERRPLLFQGILFVPKHYDKHHEWSDYSFLKSEVFIEYCSGNGAWVIEKAKTHPETLWIAVEKKFNRAKKIWSKMRNENISNLLIVCGEALTFTKYYLPQSSVKGIFINFPDPWPKEKHAKHRLVQKPFVEELARVVKEGGRATFVTDDAPYSELMIREMQEFSSLWKSSFESPFYQLEWPSYGTSYFEQLWREKGREVRYMDFMRSTS